MLLTVITVVPPVCGMVSFFYNNFTPAGVVTVPEWYPMCHKKVEIYVVVKMIYY